MSESSGRTSLRRMPVQEVMTKPVKTIESSALVEESIRLMRDNDIGCLVVLEKDLPVGIFTERDVLRRAAESPENLKLSMKVAMSKPLVTVRPAATIWEAIQVMNDGKIRHLPVVEKERLVGILTQKDIIRLFFSYRELLVAGIALEETRRFML